MNLIYIKKYYKNNFAIIQSNFTVSNPTAIPTCCQSAHTSAIWKHACPYSPRVGALHVGVKSVSPASDTTNTVRATLFFSRIEAFVACCRVVGIVDSVELKLCVLYCIVPGCNHIYIHARPPQTYRRHTHIEGAQLQLGLAVLVRV